MKRYDVSKAIDYAHEFSRLCMENDCRDQEESSCPMKEAGSCGSLRNITEESIRILQEWSDSHPEKTRAQALLELLQETEFKDALKMDEASGISLWIQDPDWWTDPAGCGSEPKIFGGAEKEETEVHRPEVAPEADTEDHTDVIQIPPENLPNDPEPASESKSKYGRRVDKGKIKVLADAGWKIKDIAEEMGCSLPTVRSALKEAQ